MFRSLFLAASHSSVVQGWNKQPLQPHTVVHVIGEELLVVKDVVLLNWRCDFASLLFVFFAVVFLFSDYF